MKKVLEIFALLSALICLAALSGAAQSTDLEKLAVNKLSEAIKKESKDVAFELKDGHLYVDRKLVTVSTVVEHDLVRNGVYIYAVRFDTTIGQGKTFSVGSVGVGKDKNDAIDNSLNEWVDYFGKALTRFWAGSGIKANDGFEFYPGFAGIRGEDPEGWLKGTVEMHDKLITALVPTLKDEAGELHSVSIMITSSDGVLSGECRIDNEVSGKLLERLKKLDWKTDKSYIFKQYYLVTRNRQAK